MQLLFAYFCNTQENQKKFIIICLHHNADSYLKLKAYYVKMCTHKWSKNIGRKTLMYLGVFTFLMLSQNDVDHQKSTSKTSLLCCLHFLGHVKWNS